MVTSMICIDFEGSSLSHEIRIKSFPTSTYSQVPSIHGIMKNISCLISPYADLRNNKSGGLVATLMTLISNCPLSSLNVFMFLYLIYHRIREFELLCIVNSPLI
jgi:hypothetical protein